MVRIGVLLGLSVLSAFVAGMPVGTSVSMILACVAGFGAVRLHSVADSLTLGGDPAAGSLLRAARFCDDASVALCVLALLYAVHPL